MYRPTYKRQKLLTVNPKSPLFIRQVVLGIHVKCHPVIEVHFMKIKMKRN